MEQLELSVAEARMIALQTLGLRHNLAAGKKGTDAVLSVLDHLSLLQMDTVNVFERAHYLPVFSRIGGFDRQDLTGLMAFDRAGAGRGGGHLTTLRPQGRGQLRAGRIVGADEHDPGHQAR